MKVSELSGKANLILKSLQKHYSLKDWPRDILGMLAISKSRHYVTSNPKNRARFFIPNARGKAAWRSYCPHQHSLHSKPPPDPPVQELAAAKLFSSAQPIWELY